MNKETNSKSVAMLAKDYSFELFPTEATGRDARSKLVAGEMAIAITLKVTDLVSCSCRL